MSDTALDREGTPTPAHYVACPPTGRGIWVTFGYELPRERGQLSRATGAMVAGPSCGGELSRPPGVAGRVIEEHR
ncbi:hypothetical protein [Rhodococcus sp. ARC_M6]|uniref:hypothetical protein n=1 Tax=Rhodococcus sp. ARC_M6 TaxID=2928852 RepID=UPI001FB1CEE6|nr:hypothetical protein [Rhodococcus sp. ARC_M6]MCJ0902445.1 hypothetical protein [Rhodococcus sp. ARC_M6]